MKEFFEKNNLKLKIMLVFSIMIFIIVLEFYPLMPSMLNYPAGTSNNDFQWELEKANYTMQFVEIASIVILIYCIIVMKKLSFLNKLDKAKKERDKIMKHLKSHIKAKTFTIFWK